MRFNHSVSRRPAVALNDDQLRGYAPSIFATSPWNAVSDRYRFVPTIEIVDLLRSNGFMPVRARQSGSRIPGKAGFVRHLINFRHESTLGQNPLKAVGDEIAELILMNSHDRGCAYNFHSGVFKLACLNGMVVASKDFGHFKVKHMGAADLKGQIIDATFSIAEDTPKVMKQIEDWKSIKLKPDAQQAFAETVVEEVLENSKLRPSDLLRSQRREDNADPDGSRNLWSTTNVVQEHLIRGGVPTVGSTGKRTKTRKITDIGKDVKLNKALWSLAAKMAELVS